MADDVADALIVLIGGGLRKREHVAGVEDIKALVLHRAHVEILNRDDVVLRQVVFAPVGFFIPDHGLAKRGQRVMALREIS